MVGEHDGVRDGSIPSLGNGGSILPSLKMVSCPSGLWCKLGKFVDVKVPEVQILYSPPGCIVQLVERFSHKEVVGGSIPPTATVSLS